MKILLAAAALLLTIHPAALAAGDEQAFVAAFQQAVASREVSRIVALFCLDNALESAAAKLPRHLEPLVTREIGEISLKEISPQSKKRYEIGFPFTGKRLVANIPLTSEVRITFLNSTENMTLPVGHLGERVCFATSKLVD